MQKTVCLDHASVKKQRGTNDVTLASPGSARTGTIIKGSGIYVSEQGVQASVNWGTFVTTEWLKEV
jgi:hypothetical protein